MGIEPTTSGIFALKACALPLCYNSWQFFSDLLGLFVPVEVSPEEPEQLAALGHEDGDGDGHQHPALDEDARVRLPVGALGSVRSGIRTRRRHLLGAARVAREQLRRVHQERLEGKKDTGIQTLDQSGLKDRITKCLY